MGQKAESYRLTATKRRETWTSIRLFVGKKPQQKSHFLSPNVTIPVCSPGGSHRMKPAEVLNGTELFLMYLKVNVKRQIMYLSFSSALRKNTPRIECRDKT